MFSLPAATPCKPLCSPCAGTHTDQCMSAMWQHVLLTTPRLPYASQCNPELGVGTWHIGTRTAHYLPPPFHPSRPLPVSQSRAAAGISDAQSIIRVVESSWAAPAGPDSWRNDPSRCTCRASPPWPNPPTPPPQRTAARTAITAGQPFGSDSPPILELANRTLYARATVW